MDIPKPQSKFMTAAIKEALKAKDKGDYAIGAVIVQNNKIIARAGNAIRDSHDPTSHAEVVVIRKAARKLKNRHLETCILYTTHEPCPMCTAAAVWARMSGIVFGAKIKDMANYRLNNSNQDWSWRTINISANKVLEKGDPKLFLIEGFMRQECISLFHT